MNRYAYALGAALLVVVVLLGGVYLTSAAGSTSVLGVALSAPAQQVTPTPYTQPWQGHDDGMGRGGMMGGGMGGTMGGMMGGPYAASAKPIAMADAVRIADRMLQNAGDPHLTFDEIEGYANNFYVPVRERSTGSYAYAWVIDRYGGTVTPEMGPNMMWNAKYGMMGGGDGGHGHMMGPHGQANGQATPTANTPVTADQARAAAQQFLDGYLPGTRAGDAADFYGFRTFDVNREGRQIGMISVNGYTGAVWYHAWHGDFLEEWERTP